MARTEAQAPDRIRGFTSLAEHEAATYEGKIVVSDQDGYRLRRIWHDGEWWHSVVDVVGALAESANPKDYWAQTSKRMAKKEGADEALTKCQRLKLPADDGKMRLTDCATTEVLFRIIESVPSKRAEPIKQFLARVGAERLEEIAQPSKIVDRAIQAYRDIGRDDEWVDGRLQNRSARNELTDEWQKRGVVGGKMAGLTVRMGEEMLGVTPSEHRKMKKLGNGDETREHYDSLELAVTTLGERAAKAMIVARKTDTYTTTADASMSGAKIAGDARRNIEKEIGRPVANDSNFLPKPAEAAMLSPPPAPEAPPMKMKEHRKKKPS